MQVLLVCLMVYLGLGARAQESCKQVSEWSGNACTLGCSLQVKSVPDNKAVTAYTCNRFYLKTMFMEAPVVSLIDAEADQTYTLVVVDPDAPNHPDGYYVLHWIVANIQGADFKKGDFKNSKTLIPYQGPHPPKDSGTHHYKFLVFRQEDPASRLTEEIPDENTKRLMFNLSGWIAKQPTRLCGPISGVQFRTNFDGIED